MSGFLRLKRAVPGSLPGFLPEHDSSFLKANVSCYLYDEKNIQYTESPALNSGLTSDKDKVLWLEINGIQDNDVLRSVGSMFQIHPLWLEDISTVGHRPKYDEMDDVMLFMVNMLNYNDKSASVDIRQISFLLGDNFVVSFQEEKADVFDPVIDRLKKGKGRIRSKKCDYLCYCLLDVVIDNYYNLLEKISDKTEKIENEVMQNPTQEIMQAIHSIKRDLIFIRKSIWPLREIISRLIKSEFVFVKTETHAFFRDLYENTVQILDSIESLRDVVSGLLEVYLSSTSNKMNEIMKVLTIISTIFIPLTFIAGIYGMNFSFMPELNFRSGYFIVLGVMALVFFAMILFFKRKKWF